MICYVCQTRQVRKNGLCNRCLQRLAVARSVARRMSADEKRRLAREAVDALVKNGIVRLRLLQARE